MGNREDAIEFYEHHASELVSAANTAIRQRQLASVSVSVSVSVPGDVQTDDPDAMLDYAADLLSLANYVRKS